MNEEKTDKKTEVRLPTKSELNDLKKYLIERGRNKEKADEIIDAYYFAVFPDYTSDTLGYRGKIMFSIYAFPSFYEVFIWKNGEIKKVSLDVSFIEE